MNIVRLLSRRHRVVVAAIVATCGALAPACLPDVQFDAPPTDGGTPPATDATSPSGDAGDGGPRSDAADGSISDATDAMPSTDAAPDVDPNAFGPFAENQDDDYGQTAICAVRGNALYCWGGQDSNEYAAFGLPADAGAYPLPTLIPSTPAPPSHLKQLAMGDRHTCALYDRTTYCYGYGDTYANTLGDTTADAGPSPVMVLGLPSTGVDLIAAASAATCAVVLDQDAGAQSNVYCWGTNGEGELARPYDSPLLNAGPVSGSGATILSDVTAIAAGGDHVCVISASRGILCWGGTDNFESGPTQGPSDAGACPGGNEVSCTYEPVAVPTPDTDAGTPEIPVALAAGLQHTCALMQSGDVYCWGSNEFAQLGVGDAGVPTTCTDTSAMVTSQCSGTPHRVLDLTNVKLIRAGGYTTCALDTSNHAFCWGDNMEAELGNGSPSTLVSPVPVSVKNNSTGDPYEFSDLSVGEEGACARSLDGDTLYCWGQGGLGTAQPDASTTPSPFSPAPVLF
jgi:alpha-tubulin suppressor-like RCC1 family protein